MLLLGVGHLRSRESLIIWVAMSKMPLCGRCCCTVDLTFVLVPWSQGRGMNTSRNDTLCFLTIFWLVVPSSTLLMWESSAQTFQCHTWLSRDQTPLIKKINWSDYLSIAQIVAWQTRMIKATPNYLSLLAWSEMMKNPIRNQQIEPKKWSQLPTSLSRKIHYTIVVAIQRLPRPQLYSTLGSCWHQITSRINSFLYLYKGACYNLPTSVCPTFSFTPLIVLSISLVPA